MTAKIIAFKRSKKTSPVAPITPAQIIVLPGVDVDPGLAPPSSPAKPSEAASRFHDLIEQMRHNMIGGKPE